MKVSFNQKIIRRHRVHESYVDFESNAKARKRLTSAAYVLYMYMLVQENSMFPLSRKDVLDSTQLSNKTYDRAVTELVSTGYLTESNDVLPEHPNNKVYDLHERR